MIISMTAREAVIQAHVELGMSREEAELRARCSDGFLPEAAALSQSPVKPGCERALIEALKQFFGKMDVGSHLTNTRSGVKSRINSKKA
jgi:hypothetical protein